MYFLKNESAAEWVQSNQQKCSALQTFSVSLNITIIILQIYNIR